MAVLSRVLLILFVGAITTSAGAVEQGDLDDVYRRLTELEAELGRIESAYLVGEFNDWDPTATAMKYSKMKKAFWVAVDLEPGREYQFRYLINGEFWCNEWDADAYVPNNLGEDNCVLVTPDLNNQKGE